MDKTPDLEKDITEFLKRAFLHHGLEEADCIKGGLLIAGGLSAKYRIEPHPYLDEPAAPAGSLLEDMVQKLETAKKELHSAAEEMRNSGEEILRLVAGTTGEEVVK